MHVFLEQTYLWKKYKLGEGFKLFVKKFVKVSANLLKCQLKQLDTAKRQNIASSCKDGYSASSGRIPLQSTKPPILSQRSQVALSVVARCHLF